VHARAVVGFGKYAIPVLAKSRGGSIANMASIASKRGVHNGEKLVAAGLVNMQGPSSPPPVQQRLVEPIDIANEPSAAPRLRRVEVHRGTGVHSRQRDLRRDGAVP
jgi:hypothetical protein